jgi:chromosomal replication initiation ATPase DnaA
MVAMRRVREMKWGIGHPSYPQIGEWFGRDHTTVLAGVRRADELGL